MDSRLPKSLLELIDLKTFRERPGMYIGYNDINILKAFVDGHTFFSSDELPTLFWEFRNWLAVKSNFSQTTGGWNHILLEISEDNQQVAIELFFKYFDEFRKV